MTFEQAELIDTLFIQDGTLIKGNISEYVYDDKSEDEEDARLHTLWYNICNEFVTVDQEGNVSLV